MADFSHLSPAEYEKISSVLRRDRELRSVEEARIRQLKQELAFLRKRAALKPGLDPLRNCARCLAELGRILNRGALCPKCLKKVCKDCRHYGDENHQWLCIYCYKQVQLKAISGEWMQDFSKLSAQRARDHPGDQMRRVLHESQRKSLLDADVSKPSTSTAPSAGTPPQKPPRSFQYEQSPGTSLHIEKERPDRKLVENTEASSFDALQAEGACSRSPKVLPRVSPWNGIDPEPTIPMRVDKSRLFRGAPQFESYAEPPAIRERQSSDEGHYTIGYRSRSTSSEVVDDAESLTSAPMSKKRLAPLRKQKAVPEPSPVENQQSSVDTIDSGVYSPGLKTEYSAEVYVPSSPLAATSSTSAGQEALDFPSNRPRLFAHRIGSDSSSSSETEEEQNPTTKKSDVLFRKVTLKKRKASPAAKPLENKYSATSADVSIGKPFTGLTRTFYPNKNNNINSFCKTNLKRKLTRSCSNPKFKLPLVGVGSGVKKQSMIPLPNNKSYADACAGRSLGVKTEALLNGNKTVDVRKMPKRKYPFPVLQDITVDTRRTDNLYNKTAKQPNLKANHCKKMFFRPVFHKKKNASNTEVNLDSIQIPQLKKDCSKTMKTYLIRRTSLPNRRTPSYDWLQNCVWKCHSLEDWLWYIEEQPYKSRDFNHVHSPDDYKLVYVSSSSGSSNCSENSSDIDSDSTWKAHSYKLETNDGSTYLHKQLRKHLSRSKTRTKTHLKVHSRIRIKWGTSYVEDSDWELESNASDDSDVICSTKLKNSIATHKVDNFLVHRHSQTKMNVDQLSNYSLHNKDRKIESANSSIIQPFTKRVLSRQSDFLTIFKEIKLPLLSLYLSLLDQDVKSSSKIQPTPSQKDTPTVSAIKCPNKPFHRPKINTAAYCVNKMRFFTSFQSTDSRIKLHPLSFISAIALPERKSSVVHLFPPENFTSCRLFFYPFCNFLPISIFCAIFSSDELNERDFSANFNLFRPNYINQNFQNIFQFYHQFLCDYFNFRKSGSKLQQTLENCENKKCSSRNNLPVSEFSPRSSIRELFENILDLSLSTEISKLSSLHTGGEAVISFYLREVNTFSSENVFISSIRCLVSTFLNNRFALVGLEGFTPTIDERNRIFSFPVTFPTGFVLCCEFYFLFPRRGEFCNPDWRRGRFGIGRNSLDNTANAFHLATASPPDLTKHGNDKSAATDCWRGKRQQCFIAATRRVIDLNLGALEYVREVLELADLTLHLGRTADFSYSNSAKLGVPAILVNTFFYHVPPVALKPEADCLLQTTRSVLFQRLLPHVIIEARMIASNLEDSINSGLVKVDYENRFCFREATSRLDAMQSEKEESPVEVAVLCRELISHSDNATRLSMKEADDSEMLPSEVWFDDGNKFHTDKSVISCDSSDCSLGCAVDDFSSLIGGQEMSLEMPESDVLLSVKYIFSEFSHMQPEMTVVEEPSVSCENIHIIERVDCQCNKPCDVPSSPSVVDATVDARSLADDGEIFSSGDELDKLESDTDSQDTVIEGEAYKRIRSVAIKEKILHANEELFGVSLKESYLENEESNKYAEVSQGERTLLNHSLHSKCQLNNNVLSRGSTCDYFSSDIRSDSPKLGLHLDSERTESADNFFSIEKHILKSLKKGNQSAFHPVVPKKRNDADFSKCTNDSSQLPLSSYKTNFSENVCSSESSDNGSDGEELVLSDISTSSDEATYIAPSASFHYYNHPVSYRLHTIVEESCEESERSSRGATPTSRASSDFEYYDKSRILSAKTPRKLFRKSLSDNNSACSTDHQSGKSSTVYAVLATSRLEKYFKSGLLEGDHMSYPEDELTDESGGISSDEEITVAGAKDKLRIQTYSKTQGDKHASKRTSVVSNEKLASNLRTSSISNIHKKSSDLEFAKQSQNSKQTCSNNSTPILASSSESSNSEAKQTSTDFVSDDEAKYIMSHLMQHISNSEEKAADINNEVKDVSPMLKILESEIARLMLTVSPASLSAGDPSSSCSSTIGSNNSDYGSDTLESGEDSTDEELNNELVPENRPPLERPSQPEPASASTVSDSSMINNDQTAENPPVVDSTVSEETLYICKQLMASLKKIADTTDIAVPTEEISSNPEDTSAKQYITDQIVSLMQTVSASHNNSPFLRTLSSNASSMLQLDSDVSQDRSDSDSPLPNDEKREPSKSKTPSESGSETTISASISIPSYDDSDRTPTESEISHEMDELYALLENNGATQDLISSTKLSYDTDAYNLDKSGPVSRDSPLSEDDTNFSFESCDNSQSTPGMQSSLLCGAASKLESLLPISIEERIARYKDAFLSRNVDYKDSDFKSCETRINVILPQPSLSERKGSDDLFVNNKLNRSSHFVSEGKPGEKQVIKGENTESSYSEPSQPEDSHNITSVKIISHNTYPLSSAIHKILSSSIDSQYLEHKLDYKIVNILDDTSTDSSPVIVPDNSFPSMKSDNEISAESESTIVSPLPKVMNPKEKASSENDLLVANYRAKTKGGKVFGTKSVGNISELENISNKSTFRDTGYYSFKSSEESFLSLDDSTASQTSTASLSRYRSLTSTETIPEEEESCTKPVAKMSLSSSNIPDAVCGTSPSKSSTLPLSLRSKLSATPGGSHRTRSSFFSTSGVLRKLTLLRDESGNSLRSSPHGRMRMRNRSLSGGSEDGKQRKASVPQISVSECTENQVGRVSAASSEKESSGVQEDEIDQAFAYHCRSQMSLSSFGGRSESVTSVYSAAGGGRYGTVTVTGEVLFGLCYNYKTSTLEITVKECRNLAAVDVKRNRSDPYVKVYLLPDRTKSGKRKTKVKKHTLSPVFDECLRFSVTPSEMEIRTLWLSVWHSDRFGRNDFLGEVMLTLNSENFENPGLKWYSLQERLEALETPVTYKGDLILALKYVPPDVTSRKFSKKPGIPVKGALEVLVREARNLMATRSNGTSDPFCKSYLLPDKTKSGKQKTSVYKKSCNPKWNHTFVYDDVSLEDLRERCLELTIWDYDKITSNDFLGGVRLCLGTGKYQGREVDWMDSVGEERSLWYTMLERPNTWVDGSLLLRPNMQSRKSI